MLKFAIESFRQVSIFSLHRPAERLDKPMLRIVDSEIQVSMDLLGIVEFDRELQSEELIEGPWAELECRSFDLVEHGRHAMGL